MPDTKEVLSLKLKAAKGRQNVIRMLRASHHGHLGGAFSCMDIVTALYFHAMNVDPQNPKMEDRDRFILSAGHKCMVQYAVLAEKGFFPKEVLDTYGSLHAKIPGHGLSIACGMAIGLKMEKKPSRVFVVTGDGELPEGSNWEAAAVASHYKLDNLVVFVDFNGLQISGKVEDIMNMTPIDERFRSFGWAVKNIDGNNMEEVVAALDSAPLEAGKPTVFIAHTVKSKGLSFAEGDIAYHYWNPNEDGLARADAEICKVITDLETEILKGVEA